MAATIERVSLMSDGFTKKLGWDDVIGIAANSINVEVEASGVATSFPVSIDIKSRLPNKATGAGTIPSPLRWDLQTTATPALASDRALFRVTKTIADAGLFLGQSEVNDVAAIVRDGGTSDATFRTALGWTTRGIATQATTVGTSTGDESLEVPDALTLLKAGGVEVLEVAVAPAAAYGVVASPARRLIRKPCKVVYYSGHGLSRDNCLGIETSPHNYACWAKAADLVAAWTLPACANLDYFVIAGCSLLRYRPGPTATPVETIGQDWSKLLAGKGGPLLALLGYADSAPSDKTAGDVLATELGTRIAKGRTGHDLVVEWLTINGVRKAWNAVAMDSSGYWWVEPRKSWGFSENFEAIKDIKGPRAIP